LAGVVPAEKILAGPKGKLIWLGNPE